MYLRQRLPWILLFSLFNGLILSIGLLDSAVPNLSVIYICLINTVVLILFLVWDYFRGRDYRRELMAIDHIKDTDSLPKPVTPYQKKLDSQLKLMRNSHFAALDKESEKTEASLNELTRWIHDLKMPMTTMKLMIDDLNPKDSSGIEQEWLRLDATLNEMLYEKRLTNIQNDLYFERVEIESVLSTIIRKMQTICIAKGVGFDIDLQVTHVDTDLKWLSFILDQLISNSIKYSRDNEVTITSFQKEGWMELVVSDAGRGIKAEDFPRIFEAGFTSTSDHGKSEATGMGLYLAKEAADAMGISIKVESQYGIGTSVHLTFPKQNRLQQVKAM